MTGEARDAMAAKPGSGDAGKNPFQGVLDKENKPDGASHTNKQPCVPGSNHSRCPIPFVLVRSLSSCTDPAVWWRR